MVCEIQECSMTYRQSETYSHKMPQKLTTTACFIQEESSGGKQFRKHESCFYAQGGNMGVLSLVVLDSHSGVTRISAPPSRI